MNIPIEAEHTCNPPLDAAFPAFPFLMLLLIALALALVTSRTSASASTGAGGAFDSIAANSNPCFGSFSGQFFIRPLQNSEVTFFVVEWVIIAAAAAVVAIIIT